MFFLLLEHLDIFSFIEERIQPPSRQSRKLVSMNWFWPSWSTLVCRYYQSLFIFHIEFLLKSSKKYDLYSGPRCYPPLIGQNRQIAYTISYSYTFLLHKHLVIHSHTSTYTHIRIPAALHKLIDSTIQKPLTNLLIHFGYLFHVPAALANLFDQSEDQ